MISRNSMLLSLSGAIAVSLSAIISSFAATSPVGYESLPQFKAGDVLSAGLLNSNHHRVLDETSPDGQFLRFELETNNGTEMLTSVALLKIRVHGATAIADASNAIIEKTNGLASGALTRPTDLDSISPSQADKYSDMDSQLYSSQIRLSGKKKMRLRQPEETESNGISEPVSAAGRDTTMTAYKRAIAARLQIDVYTSNQYAQDLLDKLAKMRATGNTRLGAGFFIDRDPQTKLERGLVDAEVWRALKNYTREELREMNDKILAGSIISPPIRQRFLDHPAYSPRHITFISAYLNHLGNVEGCEFFLLLALSAENETQALFFEQWARVLAVYNQQVEGIKKLSQVGGKVVAHTKSGVMVVIEPVDILYWSEHVDSLVKSLDIPIEGTAPSTRELVVTGMVTDTAHRVLEKRGYRVRDKFLTLR